ncbi:SpoIIE family protein phosphatase [Klenkia sp. PcliD-1-E]|uniref:SpoIIE family protein phosphatase n=1 Tax=Klenkia sp. PcliD-1-E TaxID=2954492 RepID=UPI0020971E73|nr:SpoIIE family protein phosphatase [Klenkia sp. PcliD-1-E]MCO7218367.1 SpoIIE family protein phosphatase [Klenkia sp. PcliD-1-E]
MAHPDEPPHDHGYDPEFVHGALAIDVAGVGTLEWDLTTGELTCSGQLLELVGSPAGPPISGIADLTDRVHAGDRERVIGTLQSATDARSEIRSSFRVRLSGGERWLCLLGRTLRGAGGRAERFLGVVADVTDHHSVTTHDHTSHRWADLGVTHVLEAMPAAFFFLDRRFRFTYLNARAEELLRSTREELFGRVIWEAFPAAVDSLFEVHYRHAMVTGRDVTFQAHYPPPLDAWYEVLVWPNEAGLSVYFLDITTQRREQAQAASGAASLALLAAVTEQLSGTLQADTLVARLAQLVVPALADWCVVTLVEDEAPAGSRASIHDVGAWHRDPDLRPVLDDFIAVRIPALRDDAHLLQVLASGERAVCISGATAAIEQVLQAGQAQELIGRLAPDSFAVLPLRGRDRTVGLLTLFNSAARGHLSDADLSTAAEVAGRAGMALDNARLFSQQRQRAEQLQRSLLTPPPHLHQADVAVRYLPAAEAAAVGGDWYDVFLQQNGDTVLVIGDVAGHDIAAAATMGQVRALLRGIATSTDIGPAEILTRLDNSMRLLDVRTLVTVAVVRLERDTGDSSDTGPGVTRLRWSNAGHPPPLLLGHGGRVQRLSTPRADVLLGTDLGGHRTESVTTVEAGMTVLLYTDGLIERRDADIDTGLDRLRTVLSRLDDRPLEDLCDQLLTQLVDSSPADDVAVVAVRLHAQGVPAHGDSPPSPAHGEHRSANRAGSLNRRAV